jgi:hypothetical protein
MSTWVSEVFRWDMNVLFPEPVMPMSRMTPRPDPVGMLALSKRF